MCVCVCVYVCLSALEYSQQTCLSRCSALCLVDAVYVLVLRFALLSLEAHALTNCKNVTDAALKCVRAVSVLLKPCRVFEAKRKSGSVTTEARAAVRAAFDAYDKCNITLPENLQLP